jgi:hypothetical protein
MEIKIDKPTKYYDTIALQKDNGVGVFQRGDDFYLAGEGTEAELLAAFNAHNPTPPSEPTVAEKLASVGLSVSDLKAALGL